MNSMMTKKQNSTRDRMNYWKNDTMLIVRMNDYQDDW